jgi:membrane protein YdbS with pleckstrin-like domain
VRTRLQPGEEVQILVRRHRVVLAVPFGLTIFLAGCLLAASFADRPYLVPVCAAVAAVAVLWAFVRWLTWRCDLWAVTQQRVIDESGVFKVMMIDSPLETIHNIACEQSVIGRILGYGTLNIQTAAEHGSTTIPNVSFPAELRETILRMKDRWRQGVQAGRAASPGATAPAAVLAATAGGPAAGGDTKECPFCAETIKARATVCRFCGRNL